MAITIEQKPLYNIFPVGQDVIFAVKEPTVGTFFNFKYVCEVYISSANSINLSSTSARKAVFKTTPNNAGVGIFDLSPFLESYVSSQNQGTTSGNGSKYKNVSYSLDTPHPIHLIDEYAKGVKPFISLAVKFKAEGSTSQNGAVADLGLATNSSQHYYFNGVLQHEDVLTLASTGPDQGNYGYDLLSNNLYTTIQGGGFLTNAPTTQFANINDYGTVAFLNFAPLTTDRVTKIIFTYYKKDGSTVTENNFQGWTTGGCTNLDNTFCRFIFAGVYPANLRNTSTVFQGLVAADTLDYYTFQAESDNSGVTTNSKLYTININCPNTKGYESIRLTWLNQWGAWDYFTFTQKSTKSLTTNRTTYTQMSGSWNEAKYRIYGSQGGRKNFRVNTTERIVVNTDYIAEENSAWFEDLINSTEVYILNGFDASESNPYNQITNKYVEPVLITTSDYTKKTIANDKLIQYTFTMERNKTKKTQSV